ncbi:hypothetical protein AU381_25620 [Sinorhizobium glycinis]|uniref:Uncharacterized protein n=1 Tax=Sinorhizobium glycinis TaxID=1472378 RepID=A0A178XIU0_9HYPH|nr:hypothetical protein AU381_25620 [Sinorhizobium glycinis]
MLVDAQCSPIQSEISSIGTQYLQAFPTSLRQTLRRYLAGAGCLRLLRSLMLAAAACAGDAGAAGKRLAFANFSIGW